MKPAGFEKYQAQRLEMGAKYLYLKTIGCQMNVYDSEQIAAGLAAAGFVPTFAPEAADLVIVNTCSVRAKAEQKAFSFLGRMAKLKRRKPGLIVGIAGCVAQQEGERILARMPQVDLVFGSGAIGRLPQLIGRVACQGERVVDTLPAGREAEDAFHAPPRPESRAARYLTVMRGCDNHCAYCVVPHVRGPERSRSPRRIVEEARALVAAGAREVTLLGQNVNSYGQKEGFGSFARLLEMVGEVAGLERIRFTTSHPKDLGEDLIEAFGRLPKLCPHIHLPVQSGADRVLRRMRRRYTREVYLDKVRRLRDTCPGIAVTSDIIVGFPGETEADFEQTLALVREVEFDGLFAFTYSDRPYAPASRYDGKLSEAEKRDRLQALLELQAGYTLKKNQALVGSRQEVLVETIGEPQAAGPGRSGAQRQYSGRTPTNKIVNFEMPPGRSAPAEAVVGQQVELTIERALAHSLWGSWPAAAA